MKKSKTNNSMQNVPAVIIIEGFWGAGKSTLISNIRKSYPVLFIAEPNYIDAGIKSNISEWYRKQHINRIKLAKKYIKYGENVILERSILSSVAFYYAKYGFAPKWFNFTKSNISTLSNLHVFLLHIDKKSFLNNVSEIKDKSVRSAISKNKLFYENYLYFFTDVLPKLDNQRIASIKLLKNWRPHNSISIIKNILETSKSNSKQKIKEIEELCASAVIFFDDKFLLIYSIKYRQFSLPQGHQNEEEDLIDAVSREIKEETGFIDFKIIRTITTYNYRFYDKGKIIHKTITCFLVKLRSLKKNQKRFETHEFYKNYFFTADSAIKKLNWSEDKEMIRHAQEIVTTNKKAPL